MTDERQQTRAALRDAVGEFLSAQWSHDRRAAAADSSAGLDGRLVEQLLTDLGVAGVAVPEALGGLGLAAPEAMLVVAELGAHLVSGPLTDTLVAGAALAAGREGIHEAAAEGLLSRLAAGAATVALVGLDPADEVRVGTDGQVSGLARHVAYGAVVTDLLVVGSDAVVLVPGDSVERTARRSLDLTRRLADMRLDTSGECVGGADTAARIRRLALVAQAVENAAAARACLDLTVDYLRTREQFGRPIGTFQALQHRAADLALRVHEAHETSAYAVAILAGEQPPRPGAVGDDPDVVAALAKVVCADAFMTVAGECLQLHGGIGFTWEHPMHHFLKRAKAAQHLLGSGALWREWLAARVL